MLAPDDVRFGEVELLAGRINLLSAFVKKLDCRRDRC